MAEPAIRLSQIGKQYRLGAQREKYRTLRESITDGMRAIVTRGGRARRRARGSGELFWALRDVSLEVPRGAAVGLIGRNGAGKSTLLKILSHVTEPTTGHARLRGRVGSLLEVGTGFHQELTGRENVMLNGAILGMHRSEILAKFPAIVDFAEVGAFIDTPVKHYSSGMYLRLAFAVAAHLEPEILLVDEVLAVGDAAFQKRCLGKMSQVAGEGRTVIFVSHNLEAIRRLCSHAVLLEQGQVEAFGTTGDVVTQYLSRDYQRPPPETWIDVSTVGRMGTGDARFVAVRYGSGNPATQSRAFSKGPLEFLLEIESDVPRTVPSLAVFLLDQFGTKVINADTLFIEQPVQLERGRTVVRLRMDAVYLSPGFYRVGLWLADAIRGQSRRGAYDFVESAFEIEVVSANPAEAYLSSLAMVTCDFTVTPVT